MLVGPGGSLELYIIAFHHQLFPTTSCTKRDVPIKMQDFIDMVFRANSTLQLLISYYARISARNIQPSATSFQHTRYDNKTHQSLKLKMTIDIYNMLREVDITTNPLLLKVGELCSKHRDVATTLDGEVDAVGGLSEVVAKPFESA